MVRAASVFNPTTSGSHNQKYYIEKLSYCLLSNIAIGHGYMTSARYSSYTTFYDLIIKQDLVSWSDKSIPHITGIKRKNTESDTQRYEGKKYASVDKSSHANNSKDTKPWLVQDKCLYAILENLKVRRSGNTGFGIIQCKHKIKHTVDRNTIKTIGFDAIFKAMTDMSTPVGTATASYIKKTLADQ
jgi:hypothetical protein